MGEFRIPSVDGSIPIWKAIIDPTGTVSCEAISLQSAALSAKWMVDAGEMVVALTDGEITIEGARFHVLLQNPNAIHMFGGKLYDSSASL